ncbi:hypothetical protein HK097_005623, partial [Rhizophlyctis rosea]
MEGVTSHLDEYIKEQQVKPLEAAVHSTRIDLIAHLDKVYDPHFTLKHPMFKFHRGHLGGTTIRGGLTHVKEEQTPRVSFTDLRRIGDKVYSDLGLYPAIVGPSGENGPFGLGAPYPQAL